MQRGLNRRVLILFILALAAFLSWWLSSTGPSFVPRLIEQRHEPDYYLINFTLTTMGDSGSPKHRLSADNMYHFPDNDTATLENPLLVIYQADLDSWQIQAERGLVSEAGQAVQLQGDVFIEQIDPDIEQGMEIVTRDLHISPEEEFASTEQPILIRDHYGVTEAVGMQVDLKAHHLQLMSQVRGNYRPFL